MFKRTKVSAGVLLAIGTALAMPALPSFAQGARVEITGSRIKRVDAEGALPVTVIDREAIEATGTTTVAEFVRTLPFATAGNYRPQSGSSFAGYAGADLRGLGADRTLILLDGRRLPKAAQVGSASDVNSIPLAAIAHPHRPRDQRHRRRERRGQYQSMIFPSCRVDIQKPTLNPKQNLIPADKLVCPYESGFKQQ